MFMCIFCIITGEISEDAVVTLLFTTVMSQKEEQRTGDLKSLVFLSLIFLFLLTYYEQGFYDP